MSNQLQNICVFIEDEKQLQEARELLERFGQKIATDGTFSLSESNWQYLQIYTVDLIWYLGLQGLGHFDKRELITLTELEKLLEDEKKI